jgi:hypothetical protein
LVQAALGIVCVDRAVGVPNVWRRASSGNSFLCFDARQLSVTVPHSQLSQDSYYKAVQEKGRPMNLVMRWTEYFGDQHTFAMIGVENNVIPQLLGILYYLYPEVASYQ